MSTAATSGTGIRFTGTLQSLSSSERGAMLDRAPAGDSGIAERTAAIIQDVRARRDAALRAFAVLYDGVTLDALEVDRRARARALDTLDPSLRRAMQRAADNIERVHAASRPRTIETQPEPGIVIGRRPDPLDRVGVYAPGGRAAYPSSVLMGAIPARVAGVSEVVLCSPPDASGAPATIVLAAAELAGVHRVFSIGGAGAIAAMALGTQSVPRVDRVVGPGNAYVAEAKLQLAGEVAIDAPAGPSELLVIADDTASAANVAAELLAQAEHDPLACVVVLCVGPDVASRVASCIAEQIDAQPRAAIIAESLRGQGAVLAAASIDEALEFANAYAPEHLLLATAGADALLPRVRNAGAVFVGESASVAFGDYMTGANHVLPSGGRARAYSGLSILDFYRWTSYQRVDRDAAGRLAGDTARFANAEGLAGHAAAALRWSEP
jgi:histidinol dehydrogenase